MLWQFYTKSIVNVSALTGGDVKEAILVLVSLRAPADALGTLPSRYQLLARAEKKSTTHINQYQQSREI